MRRGSALRQPNASSRQRTMSERYFDALLGKRFGDGVPEMELPGFQGMASRGRPSLFPLGHLSLHLQSAFVNRRRVQSRRNRPPGGARPDVWLVNRVARVVWAPGRRISTFPRHRCVRDADQKAFR